MSAPTGQPDGPAVSSLRFLLPLLCAHFFLHATFAGARMAAPLLILRQGHTTLAVGVMLAMLSITAVVLAIPAGRLTDRFGLRRPFAWAAASSVLGCGLCAAFGAGFQQYWALCAGAVFIGIGLNLGVIALQRHAGRLAHDPAEVKQVFSWMALAPAFSNFAGPFATGLMIDHAGFLVALGVLTGLPLVGWWLVHRMAEAPLVHAVPPPQVLPGATQRALAGQLPVPESPADPRMSPPGRPKGEYRRAQPEGTPVSAWSVLQRPGMMRLMLTSALLSMAWDVHTFVVPVLGHERGLSATVTGTLLGAFALAATAVRLVLPVVSRHLSEAGVITGAMVVAALIFALYPLAPGVWAMGVCSAVLGLALGAVQPMVMSLLHQLAPPQAQGLALGLRLTVINLTSTVLPVMLGLAGGAVGVAAVFWVSGVIQLAGARLAVRLRPDAASGKG